jgi:hypothetical protein
VQPRANCLLWGDPHVKAFDLPDNLMDGLPIPYLNNGDYWLVKSNMVWIQGRFEASEWQNGVAAAHGIAIGGPFMQNNTLLVGPKAGKVYFNSQQILQDVPSTFSVPGTIDARYNKRVVRLDDGTRKVMLQVDLKLPMDVRIIVNRWRKHIDVDIAMNQPPRGIHQDGYCGNHNGLAEDDTFQLITARIGAVRRRDLLFPPQSFNMEKAKPKSLRDCKPEVMRQGHELCAALNKHTGEAVTQACLFDVCFQGLQYAAENAATVTDFLNGGIMGRP